MRKILYALVLSFSATAGAAAADLKPMESHIIDLGSVRGVAYFTVEREGVRLVATVIQEETGTPIRVSTLLAPDQSLKLSIPGAENTPEIPVEFIRKGNRVLTATPVLATN